jgi:hypothetical protein
MLSQLLSGANKVVNALVVDQGLYCETGKEKTDFVVKI